MRYSSPINGVVYFYGTPAVTNLSKTAGFLLLNAVGIIGFPPGAEIIFSKNSTSISRGVLGWDFFVISMRQKEKTPSGLFAQHALQ